MQKIYLLLRNNMQSGPFTKDELLQLSLKGHDLVWIEGKSAGWRNPGEIPELKAEVAVPAPETIINVPGEPEKQPLRDTIPVKAGPSRHVYISLPSGVPASAITENKVSAAATPALPVAENGEEVQESFEERVARMQQRVAAYNNKTVVPETKEAVATKYTRSLDDIREEYASWLHRQKAKKTGFTVKPVLAGIAGLAFIILVSFFILKKDSDSKAVLSAKNQGIPADEPSRESLVPQYEATARDKRVAKKPADIKTANAADARKKLGRNTIAIKHNPAAKNNLTVKSNTASTSNTPVRKPVSKASTSAVLVSQKEAAQPKESVPLTHQIRVYGDNITAQKRQDGSGLQLTVQNNSRQVLKVVAVDVFYFDGNGRLLQKKTVYFSNLNPSRTLTLTAPGHKKATVVDYKLGLVSTDQGLFYAKQ